MTTDHRAGAPLLLGLTMVAASVDAISFLGLGRVFPANMTGNTVLLGAGLATGDLPAAAGSATALGAFLLGAALVGAAWAGRRPSRAMLLAVLGIEVALLAAVTGWWLGLATDAPDGAPRYGLTALAGATMGAQSAMTRAIGVPVATTYITGTWTTVSAGAGALLRRRATGEPGPPERTLTLQALVVAVYLVTAAGAALAYRFLGAAVTALPLGMLALVAVAALRRSGVIGRRPDAERR